jgi:hypothetical protein
MIPSNTTLEVITKSRMEDRAFEAEQRRVIRLASQAAAHSRQGSAVQTSRFGRLLRLFTHLTGVGA